MTNKIIYENSWPVPNFLLSSKSERGGGTKGGVEGGGIEPVYQLEVTHLPHNINFLGGLYLLHYILLEEPHSPPLQA